MQKLVNQRDSVGNSSFVFGVSSQNSFFLSLRYQTYNLVYSTLTVVSNMSSRNNFEKIIQSI